MPDLRQLFSDLIRFEIELWNAVDARLKSEFGLPLTHFEPMLVIDRLPKCRVYDIASELGITTGGTSKLVDRIEASASSPTPDRHSTTSCSAGSGPRSRSGPCGSSQPRWPGSGPPAAAQR